jgi:hypothetical protein
MSHVLCSSALHWILSPEPPAQTCLSVPFVEDLMLSREYTESQDPLGWLQEAMSVSREQIEQVSGATVGQRENSLWAAVRKLRFTASNFGQILGAARRHRFFRLSCFLHCLCSVFIDIQ